MEYKRTRLMTTRLLLSALFLALSSASLQAQNRIDRLMESYSSVGGCTFTSAVERDPDTRAVVKVVKVLEQNGLFSARHMIDAFRAERQTGEYSERNESHKRTFTLVVKSGGQSRIYMLQVTSVEIQGKSLASRMRTTVIVKNK